MGPSCPHTGTRARPLAPCGSRCRGSPTCLPQHITAKTRGQQATKGLHCPRGPHCAPHGAWLSAPRPERHPPGWAGGQSTWSCGNTGPGLLRVQEGGPWSWGSSGTKHDACLLSRKIGRGAGWSYQQGQQRGSTEADLQAHRPRPVDWTRGSEEAWRPRGLGGACPRRPPTRAGAENAAGSQSRS